MREPLADGGGFDARVRECRVGEVAAGVSGGGGVALDGDDPPGAARERQREEADAAVEVEGAVAGGVAEAGADERFEERVVDLEEAAGAEAVALVADGALLLARVLVAERGA